MAWNLGRRARRLGLPLAALSGLSPEAPTPELSAVELEALANLGPDQFDRWALRGWLESSEVE